MAELLKNEQVSTLSNNRLAFRNVVKAHFERSSFQDFRFYSACFWGERFVDTKNYHNLSYKVEISEWYVGC